MSSNIFAQGTEILNPSVDPPFFSPNSDGRKDTTTISFTSSKYWSQWTIKITNTVSNRVERLFSGLIEDGSRDVSVVWDGKDKNGTILADDIYVFKIKLESDAEPPETEIIPGGLVINHNETNFISLNTAYTLRAADHGTPVSGIAAIYYRINHSTTNIYTNAFYLPEPGYVNIYYKAEDKAGNKETEKQYSIYADGFPPSAPTGLSFDIQNADISFSWDSNFEWDLAGYNFYRNDNKLNSVLLINTSYTDFNIDDGYYNYSVRAVDIFGNESKESESAIITINKCLKITRPLDGSTNANIVVIWADMLCRNEFKYLRIEYGAGENPEYWNILKEAEIDANRKRVTCPWLIKDLNGIYAIRVVGIKHDDTLREDRIIIYINNAELSPLAILTTGNVLLNKQAFQSDNIPPEIIISDIENNTTYDKSVCGHIKITDENLSHYSVILKKDNEVIKVKSGTEDLELNICVKKEGKYELFINAKDNSGNEANFSTVFSIDLNQKKFIADNDDGKDDDHTDSSNNGNNEKNQDNQDDDIERIINEIISNSQNNDNIDEVVLKKKKGDKKKGIKAKWVSINAKGKNFISLYTNAKKKCIINIAPLKNKKNGLKITYLDEEGIESVLTLTNLNE